MKSAETRCGASPAAAEAVAEAAAEAAAGKSSRAESSASAVLLCTTLLCSALHYTALLCTARHYSTAHLGVAPAGRVAPHSALLQFSPQRGAALRGGVRAEDGGQAQEAVAQEAQALLRRELQAARLHARGPQPEDRGQRTSTAGE